VTHAAVVTSGRLTRTKLQELAASRDAGFDLRVLAGMLSAIDIYPDAEFSAYGLQDQQIQQMRERFAAWRTELLCEPRSDWCVGSKVVARRRLQAQGGPVESQRLLNVVHEQLEPLAENRFSTRPTGSSAAQG
jgi:hypothetical protein